MAFLVLPAEMNVDWHNVTFNNSQGMESLSGTNYAFCEVRGSCQTQLAVFEKIS